MSFPTRKAALASLREFAPYLRRAHKIVRFYSETYRTYRYCRVLMSRASQGSEHISQGTEVS